MKRCEEVLRFRSCFCPASGQYERGTAGSATIGWVGRDLAFETTGAKGIESATNSSGARHAIRGLAQGGVYLKAFCGVIKKYHAALFIIGWHLSVIVQEPML